MWRLSVDDIKPHCWSHIHEGLIICRNRIPILTTEEARNSVIPCKPGFNCLQKRKSFFIGDWNSEFVEVRHLSFNGLRHKAPKTILDVLDTGPSPWWFSIVNNTGIYYSSGKTFICPSKISFLIHFLNKKKYHKIYNEILLLKKSLGYRAVNTTLNLLKMLNNGLRCRDIYLKNSACLSDVTISDEWDSVIISIAKYFEYDSIVFTHQMWGDALGGVKRNPKNIGSEIVSLRAKKDFLTLSVRKRHQKYLMNESIDLFNSGFEYLYYKTEKTYKNCKIKELFSYELKCGK